MPLPVSALPVLLALLVGGHAVAQPRPAPWLGGTRRIELADDAAGQVHEVHISAGLTTALVFNGAAIDRDGVTLDQREHVRVSVAEDTLLLIPSERVTPGERLRLTVPFKDGAVPASTAFVLVVHPAIAERQVEVYRQRRTAESLRAEVQEKDAQLQLCHEEMALLQAEQKNPEGLTGLLVTGRMDVEGVTVKDITREVTVKPGSGFRGWRARSFRSAGRVAVVLWLENPASGAPWTASGAALLGKEGETLKVTTVWNLAPVGPGSDAARIVVEAESAEKAVRRPFTLILWDIGGQRTITLGNVTFP